MKEFNRKIVLENGEEFYGYGFGAKVDSINEIVFNTSMIGYQEIISDASYAGQMVVMTYPLIGNYGITDEDFETKVPTMGGLIVRDYNDIPSNFRYTKTLSEELEENNIPAISGVDTRKITRIIRNEGSQKVLITDISTNKEDAVKRIKEYELPGDIVAKVSSKKKWYAKTFRPKFDIVAIDCGIRLSMIRELSKKGCNVTVVPYNTTAEEIRNLKPDGLFVSNGPGDPRDVASVVSLVKELKGCLPIFGIGLGHQIICLAYGAKIYKMKFGHRGGNHPVKNLKNNKIEITIQNHSYAVDISSLGSTGLKLTHINLIDHTAEGVERAEDKIFSVQYHPESAPASQDSRYLFDKFISMME